MKIIAPRTFDPTKITTSVTLTETAWTAGTHALGARRYDAATYDLYEVVVASTSDSPAVGYAKDPKTWDRVGKVNRYACFDGIIGNPMTGSGLDMTIAPDGSVTNGIGIFNALGSDIRVTVTDPVDGVVYDVTTNLADNSGIGSWADWFFSPAIMRPDFVLIDLPQYASASIRIRTTGTFSIGEIVIGSAVALGVTGYGSQVGILDFSRKERDTFGNAVVVRRAFAHLATLTAYIMTARVPYVRRILADRRAVPTVFIGSENHPETIVYGFFRDFTVTLAGPVASDCSIEVEGLV